VVSKLLSSLGSSIEVRSCNDGHGEAASRCEVYDVIEGRRDYTHLQMSTDILIPLPNDWTEVTVHGAADFSTDIGAMARGRRAAKKGERYAHS
jgi:hypothetical protein